MRKQAKFYLSKDAHARLRKESRRTTYSMSTIVNMLVVAALPPAPGVQTEPVEGVETLLDDGVFASDREDAFDQEKGKRTDDGYGFNF